MANRCSQCNKFVSIELGDAEVDDVEIDGDELSGDVRAPINCGDCSDEIKEHVHNVQIDLIDHFGDGSMTDRFTLISSSVDFIEGPRGRGKSTGYLLSMEFEVKDNASGETKLVTEKKELAPSDFEEV